MIAQPGDFGFWSGRDFFFPLPLRERVLSERSERGG